MQPILKVNLTNGAISEVEIPVSWQEEYLGGASLAARLLYEHLTPGLDPLNPQAPLLFLTGPLSGTTGPAVGRFVVSARSPVTGLWGESNCGGFWGPELRRAGYDGLWVTGQASVPVFLWISDDKVEIRSGAHLWGKDTYQTQSVIADELEVPRVKVAVIGPAGESCIPFSVIMTDHGRVAGRTGMGAVMGSKNLKAIAVKGSGKLPLADPDGFARLRAVANRELREDNVSKVIRQMGSAGGADYLDYIGMMPKRYYQRGEFTESLQISGTSIAETILSGVSTCHGCVIACGRVVRLEDGQDRKGAEYETMVGFGPNLWIDDPVLVTRLGELCDRYGMDTISLSNTIGLAFTLFDCGVISLSDTEGLQLEWGHGEVVETLVHLTARRDGFGAYLAEGALALGDRFGMRDEAVQVNGLEAAYQDPRGGSGVALSYATSPRGACHNQSDYFLAEVGQVEDDLGMQYFPRHAGAEKAASVAIHQDWRTVCNSLVLCFFANVPPKTTLALVNAACGLNMSLSEMLQVGERGWNLKRVINHRLGLTREKDTIPKAFLKPFPDGGSAGFALDFDTMLEAYYSSRGWDPMTGFPLPGKLTELGLHWTVVDLYKKKA